MTVPQKEAFVQDMAVSYAKLKKGFAAPEWARDLHALLRNYSGNADPFLQEKRLSNHMALSMLPGLEKQMLAADDPLDFALRLAVAGNIMDFALGGDFDLKATLDRVLHASFAIDHRRQLRAALKKAKSVLYLGDNAGEIVFDKLLIQQMQHPNLVYAVRGAPVINDATLEDATLVNMEKVAAAVISNGYDAPSTIVERSSAEFQSYFNQADLIISKGQGNLEGLIANQTNNIVYLLMAKCAVVADYLKVKQGDFIVANNRLLV